MREEGRERGDWVRSRDEIMRRSRSRAQSDRIHWRWVWARWRSWGGAIRSAIGLSDAIRPVGPWVGDWIWASLGIALSVLRLGLGMNDESEWGEKFSEESGNSLKLKWECKMIYGCGVGILQLTEIIFCLTIFCMRNQTHSKM